MALARVQNLSGDGAGSTFFTTSKTLGATPGVGNLILAALYLGTGTADTSVTIDTANWTVLEKAQDDANSNTIVQVIYRYVQGGDTTALPAFCSSSPFVFAAYGVIEISGVSGVITDDVQSVRNVEINGATSLTLPGDYNQTANAMALLFHAKYNRSATAGVDAGYTSDFNAVNGGNYGSYGIAHKDLASANTAVAPTNTFQAGGDACGMVGVILQATKNTTEPHIVRMKSLCSGSSTQGTALFGGFAKTGNLLLCHFHYKDGTQTAPSNAGNWTHLYDALNGGTIYTQVLYRYASSETRTLPAIMSSGGQFSSCTISEISNVTGTIGTDITLHHQGYQASGSSMTTTADTTTAANSLGIGSFAEYNGTALHTCTGGTIEAAALNNASYGSWSVNCQLVASAGGTVQSTWTPSGSRPVAYTQVVINGAAGGGGGGGGGSSGDKNRLFPSSGAVRSFPIASASRSFPTP